MDEARGAPVRGRLRRRVYEILERGGPGDLASQIFDYFILSLIALNILALILETVEPLRGAHGKAFARFELASIVVFTVEYLSRVWSCTSDPVYRRPLRGRLRFAATPLAAIDLAAILPFYLPMLIPLDLRFIRALRLFRLFRLLKVGRYSQSVPLVGGVVRSKKEELGVALFTVAVLLIIVSSVMYYVENEAQPEAFGSIPAAMWWGVATLTTVGYGDVYPVTASGKACAALVALLGVATFARNRSRVFWQLRAFAPQAGVR
jgi:voltage-gated potassium channel